MLLVACAYKLCTCTCPARYAVSLLTESVTVCDLPQSYDLRWARIHAVKCGDKDTRHRLVQRKPVHVDSGTDWYHKANDRRVDATSC